MTFRVAEFTTLRQFLRYNEGSRTEAAETLERLSTLKKVNRASDNPNDYRRIKNTLSELEQNAAFSNNIENSLAKFRLTEDALTNIRESLDEAREITIQGTSFLYGDAERETIADQIQQLRLNIINNLNTRYEGEYLFSGTALGTEPFPNAATGAYAGNNDLQEVRITETDRIVTNFTGEAIAFGTTGQGGTQDVLDLLADLETAFRNNDLVAIDAEIPRLRPAVERINGLVSEVGTRTMRITREQERYLSFEETLRSTLAQIEDADLALEATQLEEINTAIDAQLRAQGTVNRQTLLDFLG